MVKVHFKNQKKDVHCKDNTLLANLIKAEHIFMEMPCNCMGFCKKCRALIKILSTGKEKEVLTCTYKLKEDIEVYIKEPDLNLISTDGGKSMDVELKPSIYKKELGVIDKTSFLPFMNTIHGYDFSLNAMKKISDFEKAKSSDSLYGILYKNTILNIVDSHEEKILGVAVDLGTTGVSMYLLDLETGDILDKSSFLNPQFKFGGDVLTRVSFCKEDEDNINLLQKVVIDKLNENIKKMVEDKYSHLNIYRVIVSGNTIMQHIFLGINPESIAKYPYRPVFNVSLDVSLNSLNINENGIVTIMPAISGFIGGDILSGIFSTGFYKKDKNILYIDIGTNGEIILKLNGKYYGTSTAAGPALEGMNISCGMRAIKGAIEKFYIDDDGDIKFKTIDDDKPIGICGSGLIDLVYVLLKKGIVNKAGNIIGGKDKKYYITEEIYVSQKDIRQIQLAKGAISTGIRMLLKEAGADYSNLDEVYIAGSFGYHLDFNSLKYIGIIDKSYDKESYFVGNSSLEGSRLALLNEDVFLEINYIKDVVKCIELSNKDDFQDMFVKELRF